MTWQIGDELLLAYGNGTQRARVVGITQTGGLILSRYHGGRYGGGWQKPAKTPMRPDDRRILSAPPERGINPMNWNQYRGGMSRRGMTSLRVDSVGVFTDEIVRERPQLIRNLGRSVRLVRYWPSDDHWTVQELGGNRQRWVPASWIEGVD